MAALALIGWDIFDFSSETAEQNSTKLDSKQDLNILYQVCLFRADRKNKMAALASDWLRHFRLLLRNRWTEFNETWQEARSQRPLPSLCFSNWSEKQDGHPGLWLAETFSTSPLKPLNRSQRNLTGSKISTTSTKFVFFGPIEKTRWPPWPWLAETFWTSPLKPLNGIQRNLTGSKISTFSTKFVFWADRKNKMAAWPLIGWDIFDFSGTAELNSTKLDRKQDLNDLYQLLYFSGRSVNKNGSQLYSGEVHDMWPFGPLVRSPEPMAQVHYCDQALSVIKPSVCPSSVRPSLTFHIFDFSSETA